MAIIGKGVFIPPTSEDTRLFATSAAADAYIESAAAKAGQSIKVYDQTTGKYKGYILQTENGSLVKRPSGSSAVVATELPTVANGDPDMDYYIGTQANGYTHYRLINGSYVAVGGDTTDLESSIATVQSNLTAAVANINTALAGKGVQLDIDDSNNSLLLLDSAGHTLGSPVVLPQSGITGFTALTQKVTTASGDKWYLIINDSSGTEITRCEIPAAGGRSDSYSVYLYNRTGGSVNFTTPAGSSTKVKISFHEDNPQGQQTSEPGHIKAYYKAQGDPDSAYVQFASFDTPQDTVTDIEVSDYLAVNARTNIKITAHGTPTQEQDTQGVTTDTTITRSLVYTINCVEMSIESLSADFPEDALSTSVFTGDTVLNYQTRGSGITKIMHIEVDGNNLTEPFSIGKSHLQALDYQLPVSRWTHGAHNLCYYFVTDEGAISNKLHNIVMYNRDGVTPIVGLDKSIDEITYGEPIVARFVVYNPDPNSETTERVEIRLLDSERNTIQSVVQENVSPTQQKVEFDPEVYGAAGTFTIRVIADNLVTASHDIVVNPYQSDYNINPITTGLVYYFNAAGHTNSDVDKALFVYDYNDTNIYLP